MNAVQIERHDGWAELVLNRPERKNAIEGTLAEAMREALVSVNADEGIRVVVLRGVAGAGDRSGSPQSRWPGAAH